MCSENWVRVSLRISVIAETNRSELEFVLILHQTLVLAMSSHGSNLLFVRFEEDVELEVLHIRLRPSILLIDNVTIASPLRLDNH